MWAIECEGLTRRFGERTAVDALTLRVAAGEVYALLGPNGAGKTTTVRLLCCLLQPTTGTARVLGLDVRQQAQAVRARVGLLTEAPGLYDRLSPRQTLRFFAELYAVGDAAARVEEYLELLDLRAHGDAPAATLSKGMKQKVALARALLHEPPVVFLDEPTAGLDVPTQRRVRELVGELRGRGRTVVLTTHNLDEAERLAGRVGVLSGRLVAEGTPDELRRRHRAQRVRVALAGADPALLVVARAVSGAGEVALAGDELLVSLADPPRQTPELVAALVAAGARITGVMPERPPLEEVYLQLLAEEEA
jgi:ABC-2 type transport system ATP-binding protein